MSIKVQSWLGLFAVIITALVLGFGSYKKQHDPPLSGITLPSVFKNVKPIKFDGMIGRRYVVHIFASWCTVCLTEHRFWNKLDKSFPIYGISYIDTPTRIETWLEKNGNPYRAVAADYAGILGKILKLRGVPETFVIDEEGDVIFHHIGPMTTKTWDAVIKPILNLN